MFRQFLIIFLTILLPLCEGFFLAWYMRQNEPEPEDEEYYVSPQKIPVIEESTEEFSEEQSPADDAAETEPEKIAEETQSETVIFAEEQEIETYDEVPQETPSETLMPEIITAEEELAKENGKEETVSFPFDDAEDVLQSAIESGIMVNETINKMLSNKPVEIAPDLEKRIEEDKVAAEISKEEISKESEESSTFDLPDEDELLQRITENAGQKTEVVPDFADTQTSEEDIAPSVIEVLGKDFNFDALKNSLTV